MAAVVFDYTLWTTRYPELASVSAPLAQLYFNEATLIVANEDCSPVPYSPPTVTTRQLILNALTAHIAKLNATIAGIAPSGAVGRVSQAAEGTVNVQLAYEASQAASWFIQTPYGASAWAYLAPYRTARYRANPGRFAQGPYGRNPAFDGLGSRGWR